MPPARPKIDCDRLRATLDAINAFGRNPATGGFNRVGFSEADMAVRRWFADMLAAEGLVVRRDAAGTVFARFGPAAGPCVMVGSHLDTVPEGGAFDGALGVAVAVECVRALGDAGQVPATAVEIVATAEEEGRFGGMLGSQAIAGQVTAEWVAAAVDADGVRLADAMRAQGLVPEDVPGAAWPPGAIAAFLELHVEQGPVLEDAGADVGIATRVSGVCLLDATLTGVANHSGTTPMAGRADAFAGLAAFAAGIPGLLAGQGSDQSRITIGRVELNPNTPHTIPGRAAFSIVIRDTDAAVMHALVAAARERLAAAARDHRLRLGIEQRSGLDPVALDAGLAGMLHAEAERLGIDARRMPSGAGHDAQTMQAVAPSALVFVPSRGGISHAPEEWTDWPAIERGAALMLAALVRLTGCP